MTHVDERACGAALPELHVMSAAGLGCAAFHPPTYTLFRINERTASVFRDFQAGLEVADVAQKHNLPAAEVEKFVARLQQITAAQPATRPLKMQSDGLEKLIINISNDCNMRCRYCYADGGAYGQSRKMMRPETAALAIDRVFARYPNVTFVMFFGGEPSLNPEAIRVACERLLALHREGALPRLPDWGLVTNGFVLTRQMEELIQRYQLVVTVSLDGPPDINDALRITPHGDGTFAQIARNIRCIQSLTGGQEPSKIEATYTSLHYTAGYTMENLIAFFDREFGIDDIHLAPAMIEPDHPLCWRPQVVKEDIFRSAAAHLVESWLTDHPKYMSAIFQSLPVIVSRREVPYLCGAGLSILAVSATGDLYPCYILFDEAYRMGNVADEDVFTSERFMAVQERLRDNAKANLSKCRDCWARGFCHVCFGSPFIETGTIDQVPDHICAMNQATAESALLALSQVQTDPAQWKTLTRNVTALMSKRICKRVTA